MNTKRKERFYMAKDILADKDVELKIVRFAESDKRA